jgi:hypothetical protein
VQPFADKPFTAIQPDSTWKSLTHPGTAYAALLVDSRFQPLPTMAVLPNKGGLVLAVATVEGAKPVTPPKTLTFSGYQWEIRSGASDRAGSLNYFDQSNAWTDPSGLLHLRISKQGKDWRSAEIKLSRSLGYGSYRFVVRDVSHLEPQGRNAQDVVQPYFVAANTVRFLAPPGTLTHWMTWEPGRASFRTVRGAQSKVGADSVAQHVFTSGVPSPGSERMHINLYVYKSKRNPLEREAEVIIEKFEFRP